MTSWLEVHFSRFRLRQAEVWGRTLVPMDIPFGSLAARVAVMTNDESVMLAAQENLASDFHITLLDSREGVLTLQKEIPLEAVILDLDASEGSAESMVELVGQLRARDEDLVLIGLIQSLTKVWRRKLLAAGPRRFRRSARIPAERARAAPT